VTDPEESQLTDPEEQAEQARWPLWYGAEAAADAGLCRLADGLYTRLVGVAPRWSPGATGLALMDITARRTERRERPEVWPPPALAGNTVQDIARTRALRPDEEGHRYLHVLDKHGMYLAAAGSAQLGLAGLEQRPDGGAVDRRVGGYWRVGDAWLPTPLALDRAEEAWVWLRSARALYGWYVRLRDARTRLLTILDREPSPAARLTLGALKATYTVAIGMLASQQLRERDDTHYRPDWRHMIIAQARANVERTIDGLGGFAGGPVCAVLIDQLYITSAEADSAKVAAGLGVPLGKGLGQWDVRHGCAGGGLPLVDALRAELRPDGDVRRLDAVCARMARGSGRVGSGA
jgi:hypothetical protein